MLCFTRVIALACIGLTLLPGIAGADVPRLINYQGILTDSGAMPLAGMYDLKFTIYPDSFSGPELWTETHDSVSVDDGLFNVILGGIAPIPDELYENAELWMGITVDSDPEIHPRILITSVPYSVRTATANLALSVLEWPEHNHNGMYYTKDELTVPGVINNPSNPLEWSKLKNVPAGFADGVDDTGGGSGDGHSLDAADGSPTDVVYVDNDGRVGIGTTTPVVKLDLRGDMNVGSEGGGHNLNAYGANEGSRMSWVANKYAFRAGWDVSGTSWAPDSIADGSFAAGVSPKATGQYSSALGWDAVASGFSATAVGPGTKARGQYSMAFGLGSMARGETSMAIGSYAQANAQTSFAIGQFARADSVGTIAMGVSNHFMVELVNDIPYSLMVGFNSTEPTLFVGPGSGAGTFGNVGIATKNPQTTLDVEGDINTATVYKMRGDSVLYCSNRFSRNTRVGIDAGVGNLGWYGTFVGTHAGRNNAGQNSTFVGENAGRGGNSGSDNTFIGHDAGYSNTSGRMNTFLGQAAGRDNNSGEQNTFVGRFAGLNNTGGISNTMVGSHAGVANIGGDGNTYIGAETASLCNGDNNTFIGTRAGYGNGTGNGNVYLGYEAGYGHNVSNELIIANGREETDILIFGDFASDRLAIDESVTHSDAKLYVNGDSDDFGVLVISELTMGSEIGLHAANSRYSGLVKNAYFDSGWYRFDPSYGAFLQEITPTGDTRLRVTPSGLGMIAWTEMLYLKSNGNVGIGTTSPGYKLQVGNAGDGTEARANAWNLLSSEEYKIDIRAFEDSDYRDALERLSKTDVVRYRFVHDDTQNEHVGVIAEHSPEEILAPDGKAISLGDYTSYLLAAVKAQQVQIESMQQEIDELRSQVESQ
jgi:hypothetical protein